MCSISNYYVYNFKIFDHQYKEVICFIINRFDKFKCTRKTSFLLIAFEIVIKTFGFNIS